MAIGSVDIQGATVYVYDEHKRLLFTTRAVKPLALAMGI
ncbi:hypothetical protein HBZC1_p0060 (plasmid) [Helicobacter bizzozeronii CIII-1]|uniref:Uncharacterized protein n=1 Tax=Helicobacter bizzozeronii (strain CIII-1) TaxID=1002804 RepID=F8KUF1_HELBC|nr:hypothetical protein HBZC1_p0060 [Helicobacter bizzozeronii CIII-1]